MGFQITRTFEGLFLSQEKNIKDLLLKTEMMDSKQCVTLCLPCIRLLKDDGEPFNNLGLYRSMVEALQYLVFTRTDLASLVHQVYQFMQSPMGFHFLAIKRILRYLKGTITFGIKYTKSDAANRVSIVFLRDNLVS